MWLWETRTILTSPDGASWSVRPYGVTNDLTAVAYGKGHFVAVGSSGVILESGPVMHLDVPKVLSPGAVQFTLTGPVGQLCQIQVSTDLANWVALTELLLVEPNTTFVIISSEKQSRLFYQIVSRCTSLAFSSTPKRLFVSLQPSSRAVT